MDWLTDWVTDWATSHLSLAPQLHIHPTQHPATGCRLKLLSSGSHQPGPASLFYWAFFIQRRERRRVAGGPCWFRGYAARRLEENKCNLLFRERSKEGSVLNTSTLLGSGRAAPTCATFLLCTAAPLSEPFPLISSSCAVSNMWRIVVGRPGKCHVWWRQNKTNSERILRGKLLPNIYCTMWFSGITGSVKPFHCLSQ